ncbi:MAG: glycosyltransferase family 39 protein [Gammaproteobacteria bacterium]|nr:glycosyltransferase family 39 protein [Gammaproteobacteria bacterium]
MIRTWLSDRYLLASGGVILLLSLYRLLVLVTGQYNLGIDEAYYWYWAQHLDFGYYSKPPMLAWLIAATTAVCGDGEVCVRTGSLLLYPVISLIIYYITRRLFNPKAAFFAATLFFSMPGVALGNILITTDGVLLFFWALSLGMFFIAITANRPWQWLTVGVTAGLGLLSKYTMIIFAPSALLFLALDKSQRRHLRNPWLYVAALIALLVFMPNIIWNLHHHNPTLHHTLEISHLDHAWLQLDELAVFILGQLGVFGIVSFMLLIAACVWYYRQPDQATVRPLSVFVLVYLGIIALQALLAGANANWAVPAYIMASMLVGNYLAQHHRHKIFALAVGFNVLLVLPLYHFDAVLNLFGVELTRDNDAYYVIRGWRQLTTQLQPILKAYPQTTLLFDSRHEMAEVIYYLQPHPFTAVKWNPKSEQHDQFDLATTLTDKQGRDFIYITSGDTPSADMLKAFTRVEPLQSVTLEFTPRYHRRLRLFLLHGFLGYAS